MSQPERFAILILGSGCLVWMYADYGVGVLGMEIELMHEAVRKMKGCDQSADNRGFTTHPTIETSHPTIETITEAVKSAGRGKAKNPRLEQCVNRLVDALHDVIRELKAAFDINRSIKRFGSSRPAGDH